MQVVPCTQNGTTSFRTAYRNSQDSDNRGHDLCRSHGVIVPRLFQVVETGLCTKLFGHDQSQLRISKRRALHGLLVRRHLVVQPHMAGSGASRTASTTESFPAMMHIDEVWKGRHQDLGGMTQFACDSRFLFIKPNDAVACGVFRGRLHCLSG
jgi:hypothetical protein